jgi:pimeloyl-ACP methyl ester carboxylesterase
VLAGGGWVLADLADAALQGDGDREAIPPDAERQFAQRMGATTVEIPSSHVAMVSHPDEVAELIEKAAASVGAAAAR